LCYVQCQEKFYPIEQNLPSKQKFSPTLMPYATPIKTVNNYQMESKSLKNMVSDPNASTSNPEWNWKHPSIQESFYLKIDAPSDAEDARIKMNCHQHAVKDFNLQIEINDLEMETLKDHGEILPYNEGRVDELEQKKLKLLIGKRFHQNATNAYWYYLAKATK